MKKTFPTSLLALALLTFGAGCVESDGSLSALNEVDMPAEESPSKTETMPTSQWTYQGELPAERIQNKQVRIETAKGTIVFELLPDVAPITVSNFVYLAEGGYYDGLTFHRVVTEPQPFVVQGGDPLGDGTGGPGYNIPAEFNDVKHDRGVVAMARAMDPDSAGSQFYITLGPAYFLDNQYTVFGRVLEGMDVVDQIVIGDVMTKVTIEDKP
jgi:cyclophilin family peptidyl-prolyl cis-trans isomerase